MHVGDELGDTDDSVEVLTHHTPPPDPIGWEEPLFQQPPRQLQQRRGMTPVVMTVDAL